MACLPPKIGRTLDGGLGWLDITTGYGDFRPNKFWLIVNGYVGIFPCFCFCFWLLVNYFTVRKTSDSECSSPEEEYYSDPSDLLEVEGNILAYQDEPLADEEDDGDDDERDEDDLSPAVLEARYTGEVSVNNW